MPSPVRIEAEVWDDWRFPALGEACGYNEYEAIGRMAKLWSACTDRETDILPAAAVRVFLGPQGDSAIVECELGEVHEHGIRIKGAERFAWLLKKRNSAQPGGQARARSAKRVSGKFTSTVTSSSPACAGEIVVDTTNSPAVAGETLVTSTSSPPALHQQSTSTHQPSVSVSGSDQRSHTHARAPAPPDLALGSGVHGAVPPHATSDWTAAKHAVMRVVVPVHLERFNALRAELGADIRSLQHIESERALRDLLNGYTSFDGMTTDCLHAITIAEAEARRTGSFQFFGTTLWSEKTFRRAKHTKLEEARAGPRNHNRRESNEQTAMPRKRL